MEPPKVHRTLIVMGKVQGVFFRANTKQKAEALGLKGIVKNLIDGSVWIEAEGPEGKIQELIDWCQSGPDRAEVAKVIVGEDKIKNYQDFSIVRGAV